MSGNDAQQRQRLELERSTHTARLVEVISGTADEVRHEERIEPGLLRPLCHVDPVLDIGAACGHDARTSPGRRVMAEAHEKYIQDQLSCVLRSHVKTSQ